MSKEEVIVISEVKTVPEEVYEGLPTPAEKVRAAIDWIKAHEKENGLKSEEKVQK